MSVLAYSCSLRVSFELKIQHLLPVPVMCCGRCVLCFATQYSFDIFVANCRPPTKNSSIVDPNSLGLSDQQKLSYITTFSWCMHLQIFSWSWILDLRGFFGSSELTAFLELPHLPLASNTRLHVKELGRTAQVRKY